MKDRAFTIYMVVWAVAMMILVAYDLYIWMGVAALRGYLDALEKLKP